MRNAHRHAHKLIWIVLVPVLAGILFFAFAERPADPMNSSIPDALTEEGN